jgi:hypothetical protein
MRSIKIIEIILIIILILRKNSQYILKMNYTNFTKKNKGSPKKLSQTNYLRMYYI